MPMCVGYTLINVWHIVCAYVCMVYSRNSELRNPRETTVSISLKFDLKLNAILYIFHQECSAMRTMKHKLAYIEAKALRYRAKLDDPFPFYRNFDDTYIYSISVSGYRVLNY